jgi:hypothetical protein
MARTAAVVLTSPIITPAMIQVLLDDPDLVSAEEEVEEDGTLKYTTA